MTLNISLPLELETRVREHVASGLYGYVSEVIREALRLFEAHQAVQAASLVALKADMGLPVVRLRDMRHSMASNMVNARRSIYEVAKVLGHTQLKTTQRYGHLSNEALLAA